MQPIERDANLYAIKRLKQFGFRFKNEFHFNRTLEIVQDEFDNAKFNAKKELGMFYKIKVALKSNKKRNKKYFISFFL